MLSFLRLRLPIQISYVTPTSGWPLRRWIYSPSLSPPQPTVPTVLEQTSEEHRPHLPREQFGQMLHPSGYDGLTPQTKSRNSLITEPPEKIWSDMSPKVTALATPPSQFSGRSIAVTPQHNVAQAWSRLHSILKQNNIRRELRLMQRHEKKGVKRRRLRSERWRRKFADEVRKKVKLVNEIRLRDRMWGASRF